MSVLQYSTTASANTSVDGVNIAEGMPPGNVNNGMRAMMADTRKWQLDSGGFAVTGGTGNVYTISASQDFDTYASGMRFTFRSNRANTGDATINISGKGAVQLRKFSGGVTVPLNAGDVGNNEVIDVVYSAAIPAFVLIGKADVTESQIAMTGPGFIGKGTSGSGQSTRIGFGDGLALLSGNLIANLGNGLSFVGGAITAAVQRFSTQSEAEEGTNNTSAITPLRLRQAVLSFFNVSGSAPVYSCRSWGAFNGNSGSVARLGGGNFASVSRERVGEYVITFAVPMSDSNYAIVPASSAADSSVTVVGRTSSAFRIQVNRDDVDSDADYVSFAVFR